MFRNFSLYLTLIFGTLFLLGCQEQSEPPPADRPPPAVDVAVPLQKTVTDWDEYIGRFRAIDEVQVRSRVTGYLDAIRFEDGAIVKKGDVLFDIDPRTFKYNLEKAQAQFALAEKEFKRAEDLTRTQALSRDVYDQRLQNLTVAQANLNQAKLDVAFTTVKAPISGRISRHFLTTGNLVTADETVLTRIVSVDPVHFYFEISQNQLLKYLRLAKSNNQQPGETKKTIYVKLQDEVNFEHQGTVDFLDNVVDPSTGTLQSRAIINNPNGVIYPGLFGKARLRASAEYTAIIIPLKAVNSDQSRKFVYVVDEENKANRAYIELGPSHGDELVIIRSGLTGDEQVVVSGIQRIRAPQQPVTPNPVVIQDNLSDFSTRALTIQKAAQQSSEETAGNNEETGLGS